MRKLQAESKLAAQYFFEAMIAGDPNIFVTKTSDFSIMNPDMSLLTPSDAEKARALRTAASEAFKALDSNIEAIRRFSVDKSLIAGTQLPWGKDVIFRIDDFDGEKIYVTEIYTNEKTELVFADLKPEVLQQINGIIDRRIEAMQANMQGVNFTEDPDRHYLFFTLLRSNCHASWMKAIAPNATWEMLIDGLVISEAK